MSDVQKEFVEQMEQECADLVKRRIVRQRALAAKEVLEDVEVNIELKIYNPALYKRPGGGGHVYYTRLLTEEELNMIRQLKFNSPKGAIVDFLVGDQCRVVTDLFVIGEEACSGYWDRIYEECLNDRRPGQGIITYPPERRRFVESMVEREVKYINSKICSRGLPFRLTYIPPNKIAYGGYRFYKIKSLGRQKNRGN